MKNFTREIIKTRETTKVQLKGGAKRRGLDLYVCVASNSIMCAL